jgi:molecular chaperone HscB
MKEQEKYQLAADFPGEMMKTNDKLMEAQMNEQPETLTNLHSKSGRLQTEIYEPVKEIVEHYQEGTTAEKELLQVKDYYFKK